MKEIEKKILQFARYYIEELKDPETFITPELVLAICRVESSLNPMAVRVEPEYRWLYKPHMVRPRGCDLTTEMTLQRTSWGLMQIMGAVAREYGYKGWLTGLLNIEQNLWYGVRHLHTLEKRGKFNKDNYTLEELISDYNDGNWRRFDNKEYVERVMNELNKLKGAK